MSFNNLLSGGIFYAPVLLIDGNAHNLGSLGDNAQGHVRIQRDGSVWTFEDRTDSDFNDLRRC